MPVALDHKVACPGLRMDKVRRGGRIRARRPNPAASCALKAGAGLSNLEAVDPGPLQLAFALKICGGQSNRDLRRDRRLTQVPSRRELSA
jgi:hypothetical protein